MGLFDLEADFALDKIYLSAFKNATKYLFLQIISF